MKLPKRHIREHNPPLRIAVCLLAMMILVPCGRLRADDAAWGDLKMRFVLLEGLFIAPKALAVTKDFAVCGDAVPDETYSVSRKGELRNVLVWLIPSKDKQLIVHPEMSKFPEKVTLEAKSCRFRPHVMTARVGQELWFKNSDVIGHNPTWPVAIAAVVPGAAEAPIAKLGKSEKRATPVSCGIHPWMSAWVLVQDHPYMGVSDENGLVEIKNLPVGKHTFQLWQEWDGFINPTGKVKFNKGGKGEIEINEGPNDLGELKVMPKE